jgi:hypothetical protein
MAVSDSSSSLRFACAAANDWAVVRRLEATKTGTVVRAAAGSGKTTADDYGSLYL